MPALTKHTIQIAIVDDSRSERCEAHCGVDWSSAETIALASQRIKERFGDRIHLEYLDLSNPRINYQALELNQGIKNKELPLPVLVVNGHPRISGQFDIRQLLDVIDAEVEIGNEEQ